jgi:recombination protein RecT
MSGQVNKKEMVAANQSKVYSLLEKMKPQIAHALPKHLDVNRFVRTALTEFRKTPLLWECEPMSFVGCCVMLAQLGLELGPLGQAYLLPFRNNKTNTYECTMIIGYKGQIDLARRSGQIISLSAHAVFDNDIFNFAYGLNEVLEHVPTLRDRGELKAVYAVARLVGGGHQFEVLSIPDVEKVRMKSKAKDFGPWKDSFEEMAKKTAIRKLFKYLPVSVDLQRAFTLEDRAEATSVVEALKEDDEGDDLVANFFEAEASSSAATVAIVKTQAAELADKL